VPGSATVVDDGAPERTDPLEQRHLDDMRAASDGTPPAQAAEDVGPTHRFHVVDHVHGRDGWFTSVVPDIATKGRIARDKAAYAYPYPWAHLDPDDQHLFLCVVLVTHCLSEAPDWFKKDPLGARTSHVIQGVGERILAHQGRFLLELAAKSEAAAKGILVHITPLVGGQVSAAVEGESAVGERPRT